MASTLLDKVWDAHTVRTLPSGQTQLLIGLHLIHEVTSPQAFQALNELGLPVRMPSRTFATLDHIIPTTAQQRPFADAVAEEMTVHMIRNAQGSGVTLFGLDSGQVREAASRLGTYAREAGVPVVLVGHVTKDGTLAGPRTLEHLVDVHAFTPGQLTAVARRTGFTDVRVETLELQPTNAVCVLGVRPE